MHVWTSSDDSTSVHYHDDYSDNVTITRHNEDGERSFSMQVPFAHLREFYLNHLRDKRIGELELAEGYALERMLCP
jgi:hypothetical protein